MEPPVVHVAITDRQCNVTYCQSVAMEKESYGCNRSYSLACTKHQQAIENSDFRLIRSAMEESDFKFMAIDLSLIHI